MVKNRILIFLTFYTQSGTTEYARPQSRQQNMMFLKRQCATI